MMSSVLQNLTFSSLVHSRPEVNLLVEIVSSRCKNDTVKSHLFKHFPMENVQEDNNYFCHWACVASNEILWFNQWAYHLKFHITNFFFWTQHLFYKSQALDRTIKERGARTVVEDHHVSSELLLSIKGYSCVESPNWIVLSFFLL